LTEFKNKKVVVVAVPGAFTPTCSAMHLPPYIEKLSHLKSKGVDEVVFIAFNDPFVMAAWGKANGVKDNSIVSAAHTRKRVSSVC
jgi:alkyl hydroperoxide reductase 1